MNTFAFTIVTYVSKIFWKSPKHFLKKYLKQSLKNAKADMLILFSPACNHNIFCVTHIQLYRVGSWRSRYIMIFGILSMCFGKFFVTKLSKPKVCYVLFLMLSFIRFFHLQYLTVSVRKMSYKNLNFDIFHNLMLFKNLSVCLAQISVTKFPKWKIWDVYFLHFSMLIVIR